jgi:hypothetical protein
MSTAPHPHDNICIHHNDAERAALPPSLCPVCSANDAADAAQREYDRLALQCDASRIERDKLVEALQKANDPLSDERNRYRASMDDMRIQRDAWKADSERMKEAWNDAQTALAQAHAALRDARFALRHALSAGTFGAQHAIDACDAALIGAPPPSDAPTPVRDAASRPASP